MEAAQHPWPALGALLLRDGLVEKDELELVLTVQEDSGHHRLSARRLGELLVDRGTITHAQVAQLIAEQYELPYIALSRSDVNLAAAGRLSEELAHRFAALPISVLPDGSLLVAVSDPPLVLFSDEFRRLFDVPLRYAVAANDELDAAIAYAGARASGAAELEGAMEAEAVDAGSGPQADSEPMFVVPDSPPSHRSAALGALLLRDGLVSKDELDAALAQQRIGGNKRLGEILVERRIVTRRQVAQLVAEQYDLPFVDLDPAGVQLEASSLLSEEVARRLSALPVKVSDDGSLLVVVADPTNVVYAEELRVALEAPIRFAVACPDEIEAAIAQAFDDEPVPAAEWTTYEEMPEEVPEAAPALAEDEAPVEEQLDEEMPEQAPEAAPALAEDETPVQVQLDDEPVPAAEWTTYEEMPEEAPEAAPALAENETPVHLQVQLDDEEAPVEDQLDEDLLAEVEEAVALAVVAPEDESVTETADDDVEALLDEDLDAAIRLALSLGATSVQFTPQSQGLVVRGRVDGLMQELGSFPAEHAHTATSRLAHLAGLDGERRVPQQGLRAFADGDRTLDLNVTTLPTRLGVQVTVRFPALEAPVSITDLPLGTAVEAALRDALRRPDGAVVVCGPPVSGRTTTLYAALEELASQERTVVTIEDPVERLTPGIDQVEVDRDAGVTFARGLRAILRSDADVVLVGDVRDGETAQMAFRGARTKHVLAAVEALSASAAVDRLIDLGVERRLLASTLSCLAAQRLVRRICVDCRETYYASAADIAELGRPAEESGRRLLARGRGCAACGGSGYRGWSAVFEALPLTDEVLALVGEAGSSSEIRAAAVSSGMSTLREAAVGLCLDGVTTVSEIRLVPAD